MIDDRDEPGESDGLAPARATDGRSSCRPRTHGVGVEARGADPHAAEHGDGQRGLEQEQPDEADRGEDHRERQQQDAEPLEAEGEAAELCDAGAGGTRARGSAPSPGRCRAPSAAAASTAPSIAVRLLRQHDGVGLEDRPRRPAQLRLDGRHRVLGERGGVHGAADRLEVLARVQLRAPGQAGHRAEHVLRPPRGRAAARTYSMPMKRVR